MKYLIIFQLCLLQVISYSQSIGINNDNSAPNASAMLDIKSTSKGILIPRMTMAQRNVISIPASGLMIYQTDNIPGFYYYDGTVWSAIGGSVTNGWSLTGNSSTNPSFHYLGTADNQPIRFRINNKWAGELNSENGNIFFGDSTGISNTTGTGNIGIGYRALKTNTTGAANVGIGTLSLLLNNGFANTAVGSLTLSSNTSGQNNTAIGNHAMEKNTTGQLNTGVGTDALNKNVIGHRNTAIGSSALTFSLSSDNTAVGCLALHSSTNANENTAVGAFAMEENVGGNLNSTLGIRSLRNNQIGHYNNAIGANALYSNTEGNENTAVGNNALYWSNGSFNTAVGVSALFANQSGYYNTAIGQKANENNTTGYDNVAIGAWAMINNTSGYNNVAIGADALTYNNDGDYNIAIGDNSGTTASYNNTVSIGNQGTLNAGHNQVLIGNYATTWNGGNVGWGTYSDARVKSNIHEDVKGLDFITRLRPVTYYRDIDLQSALTGNQSIPRDDHSHDIEQIKFSGFLAQEVEQAANACGYDFYGVTKPRNEHELYTLSYESFVVPLVKAMQEQQTMIEGLKQLYERQLEINADLENRLATIEVHPVNK